MLLKNTSVFPTDASFECDWGDGSALLTGEVNDYYVEADKNIPIEHYYSSSGHYNVSCRLNKNSLDKIVFTKISFEGCGI